MMKKAPRTKSSTKKTVVSSTPRRPSLKSGVGRKDHAGLKGQRGVARLRKRPIIRGRTDRVVVRPVNSKDLGSKRRRSSNRRVVGPRLISPDPIKIASVKQYEAAIKLLYSQEFERAKTALERIIKAFPGDNELLERVKSHLRLCDQRTSRRPSPPKTVEDYYNLAVALMNENRFSESLEQLNKALKVSPNCDYVIYALAALCSRSGDLDNALNYLRTAIKLKPENRFLAQNDSDFEPLVHDTRFASIVFPERLAGLSS